MVQINTEVKKLIEENTISFATVNQDNTPNVIGVACVKVVSANQLVITDNFMKQTKENIKINDNICLAVWDSNWEGYKFLGKAKYFSEGEWVKFVKKIQDNKNLPTKGAILITISEVIELR